ncbi:protein of unknown function [Taphrina deformans PYCC 5710]|uniref:Cytochrome P450 n=1 Tax=Taphrina deformans (strain PYCC 5710 / ATCC 11124 / CBS 356.35 / IMI 108563 / JCM 9778 / NBRC 8474) TaxID=1097556 RepID=R4XJT4_TAPDE|nr:protein of unknown function [Taphrina deformans PYCC 5710]|eukprot:CCG84698.1 protein of unknown function [Taphrina deformans PYCC 5710]
MTILSNRLSTMSHLFPDALAIPPLTAPSSLVLTVVLVLVALAVHQWPTRREGSPPLVRGLPIIGVLPWLLDTHAYFLSLMARKGPIFTLSVWTYRIHVILDPRAVPSVLSSESALSFREIERWIDDSFFNYPASVTAHDDLEFRALEGTARAHLVGKASLKDLTETYLDVLHDLLEQQAFPHDEDDDDDDEDGDGKGKGGWIEVELFDWVRRLVFTASSKALFGPNFPATEVMDVYWNFEASLSEFLFLPSLLLGRQRRVRDRLHRLLATHVETHSGFPGCSSMIRDRVRLGREFGYSSLDIAKTNVDILFALQANATPMAFWSLAHLLTATEPYLSPALLSLSVPHQQHQPEQDYSDAHTYRSRILTALDDPSTTAVYEECLRLHAHASLLRKCTRATTVGGFVVLPGDLAVVPVATLHHAPGIWHRPSDFLPDRFGAYSDGRHRTPEAQDLRKAQVLVPFGGGVHYCPGRHFAKVEIMALTLSALDLFEMEALDPLPSGWDPRRYGSGTQQPIAKMRVRMRRKRASS